MKPIPATPEGREGIWTITPQVAGEIVTQCGEYVHCYLGVIGADWENADVLELIYKRGVRIAIVLPPNFTMRHSLVILTSDKRYSFDVGEVTEADIQPLVPA